MWGRSSLVYKVLLLNTFQQYALEQMLQTCFEGKQFWIQVVAILLGSHSTLPEFMMEEIVVLDADGMTLSVHIAS